MKPQLLLVRDGLEGAARAGAAPADVVLLRIPDRDPVATCWTLHRQGHRSVVAASGSPSSKECIKLLNAGADYYLDAWLPAAELVARIRVVLRFSAWLGESTAAAAMAPDERLLI